LRRDFLPSRIGARVIKKIVRNPRASPLPPHVNLREAPYAKDGDISEYRTPQSFKVAKAKSWSISHPLARELE